MKGTKQRTDMITIKASKTKQFVKICSLWIEIEQSLPIHTEKQLTHEVEAIRAIQKPHDSEVEKSPKYEKYMIKEECWKMQGWMLSLSVLDEMNEWRVGCWMIKEVNIVWVTWDTIVEEEVKSIKLGRWVGFLPAFHALLLEETERMHTE